MDDERDLAQVEHVDETAQRIGVEVEGIVVHLGQLVRAPEADEVRGHDAVVGGQQWDHLAIEIRPRRLAVQAQHRLPRPFIHVMNTHSIDLDVVRFEGEAGQVGEAFVGRAIDRHQGRFNGGVLREMLTLRKTCGGS